MSVSDVDSKFDAIKMKNDFSGNVSKSRIRAMLNSGDYKIKELYRMYIAYTNSIIDKIDKIVEQQLIDDTSSADNIYDLIAIVLNSYKLEPNEWNFMFEELSSNFNINNFGESKGELLIKYIKGGFKEMPVSDIVDDYTFTSLNKAKNEMHVNTFMTKRIKSKFFDLDTLSRITLEILDGALNKDLLRDINETNSNFFNPDNKQEVNAKLNYVDKIEIDDVDSLFVKEDKAFKSTYLDFSDSKSIEEVLASI